MTPRLHRIAALSLGLAMALSAGSQAPAQATGDGLPGAYLAARSAAISGDYADAAAYFAQALARDPLNAQILDLSLIAEVSLARFDAALPLARRLADTGQNQLANIILAVDRIDARDWDGLLARLNAGQQVSPLIDGLLSAWAQVAVGRMSDALAAFDTLAETDALRPLALVNKAMALGSVGDFEGAEAILAGTDGVALPTTRRGVLAHAEVLSQLDRNADALALFDAVFGRDADAEVTALRARLKAGETVPFSTAADAREGIGEVFLNVAGAISDEMDESFTLVYARVAQHLAPGLSDATLMVADLLQAQKQNDLAVDSYRTIPVDSPAFPAAQTGLAGALYDSGRVDAALEVLQALATQRPDLAPAHIALGDMLRREQRFAPAVVAYDRAFELLGTPQPTQWPLYFARAIAHERSGEWPKAESDLREALALSPDQPAVLNYLGYSYLEKRENLDEALAMIQRAVAARPQDGAITDSLGWGLYRLGRYDEAAPIMERAASLEPVDPVVNDHLGDVLWAVGRKLEAEFQWRRALSFDPAEADAARIRRKLEVGLDVVLKDEGAAPIVRPDNAN